MPQLINLEVLRARKSACQDAGGRISAAISAAWRSVGRPAEEINHHGNLLRGPRPAIGLGPGWGPKDADHFDGHPSSRRAPLHLADLQRVLVLVVAVEGATETQSAQSAAMAPPSAR